MACPTCLQRSPGCLCIRVKHSCQAVMRARKHVGAAPPVLTPAAPLSAFAAANEVYIAGGGDGLQW